MCASSSTKRNGWPSLCARLSVSIAERPSFAVTGFIRQFAIIGSHAHKIAQAIQLINLQFNRPLVIENLAESVNMSTSAFHKHFKRVTAMSPLQYQKHLRLQHARRLLITNEDAARAGYAVGYESASQFSREYARLFGAPPARDALRLQRDLAAFGESGSIA